jgi:hypothetical protein
MKGFEVDVAAVFGVESMLPPETPRHRQEKRTKRRRKN